jgi:hypothetical protein
VNKVYQSLALLMLISLSLSLPLAAHAKTLAIPVSQETTREANAGESPWIDAIWRIQHLNLHYQSFTSRYSCEGLERKVTDILQAVGAYVRLEVESACTGTPFTGSARLSIAIASPVAATRESVERATSYNGRDRLIARIRNVDLPQAADLQRFPAQWESILLTSQRPARLTTADCDLLSALNEQVFPHLAVRLNRRSFSCPSTASRVRPRIVVTALRPASIGTLAHSSATTNN